MVTKLLKVGHLPYALKKQLSIPLINLGRKFTLKWWRRNFNVHFSRGVLDNRSDTQDNGTNETTSSIKILWIWYPYHILIQTSHKYTHTNVKNPIFRILKLLDRQLNLFKTFVALSVFAFLCFNDGTDALGHRLRRSGDGVRHEEILQMQLRRRQRSICQLLFRQLR